MRMRKKKWADPFLNEHPEFVIATPEDNKGKWKEILNCSTLHVEIGSGRGDYFIKMAKMYPKEGWIGIEKEHNCAAVAAKKSLLDPSSNQLLIVKDATDIAEWFEKNEIDILHLNFSDPWPKTRNCKRRLSHSSFLKKYLDLLSDDGKLILKSDNTKFVEFSLVELTHNGFVLDEVWLDFRKETHDEDAISEYEAKFIELNQPIYRAIFSKAK